MGGDDSQKLLPWRGIISLPGRKPPAHYEINTVTVPPFCRADQQDCAQLQTAWIILGKQGWITFRKRRSSQTTRSAMEPPQPGGETYRAWHWLPVIPRYR